jgi:two-component system response regulator YesN
MMPKLDGLALIEKIMAHRVPMTFIILSGYDKFEYAQRAIRFGVSEYLLKPVQMDQLHEALRQSGERFSEKGELNQILVTFQNLLDRFDPEDTARFYRKSLELFDRVLLMPRYDGPTKLNLLRLFEHKITASLRDMQSPLAPGPAIELSSEDDSVKQRLQGLLEEWVLRKNDYDKENHHLSMKKACDYIHANYRKDLSLTQMAKLTNMSISHFSLWFKKYAGKTLVQYIQEVRITKAKELLRDTSLKAYEIAEETGFSTQSYFVRVFKNTTGMPPSEYKKRIGS